MTAKDNITLPREVVQDALDALTGADDFSPGGTPMYRQEITALRKALAAEQPKKEQISDAERLDWLTERLADTSIDGADPTSHFEGDEPWSIVWRRAIDAAMRGEGVKCGLCNGHGYKSSVNHSGLVLCPLCNYRSVGNKSPMPVSKAIPASSPALAAEPTKQGPVADEEAPRLWAWMREGWSADCGPWYEVIRNDQMTWRDRKGWTPLYTAPPDAEALRRDAELGRWIREETPPIEEIAARVDAMEDKR